jgi:nitrite reductase (NADH) small subunit
MSTASTMRYRVGSASSVPAERGLLVRANGIEIGIFRRGEEFHAFENVCAHQGGPVCSGVVIGKVEQILRDDKTVASERESPDDLHVICPWHGVEYEIETGECVTDRRMRLRRFEVDLEDGDLFVTI